MRAVLTAVRKPFRILGRALDACDHGIHRFLNAKAGLWSCLGIGAVVTLLFWFLAMNASMDLIDSYPPARYDGMRLLLAGLFIISLSGLFRMLVKREATSALLLFLSVAWIATLLTRVSMFDHYSPDYRDFLSGWVYQMEGSSFSDVFSQPMGDYNPLYTYLLYGIANMPLPDQYLIKLLSVCFDYVGAFFVMRLVALKTERLGMRLGALFAALWLPTALLNSAQWAQCDMIFTSLALGGLYFSLTDRPYRGAMCFALSFALKLQAVFLLPLIAPLFAKRKLSLKHLLCFVATYFVTLMPAWLAGQPLVDLIGIYANQAQIYQAPTLDAPSVFAFFQNAPYDTFADAGIWLALGMTAAVCGMLYRRGSKLTTEMIICAAMLFSLSIPLLLPAMHERYFFAADVVGVVFLFYFPRRWYIPFSVIAASFFCYHSVTHPALIVPLLYLALTLVVAAALCAMHLARLLRDSSEKEL